MGSWQIIQADVLDWCAQYEGPPFHACLCDPPYHLTPDMRGITRYNAGCQEKWRSRIATAGFMGKQWDGGTLAFQPNTWAAIMQHLLPGAWLMAFASSRGWHRVACAIEGAGCVIQPSIFNWQTGNTVEVRGMWGWLNSQAFPKSSRIDTKIDKRKGYHPRFVREVVAYLREARDKKGITNREIDNVFGFSGMAGHWCGFSQPEIPRLEYWPRLKELLSLDDSFDEAIKAHEREVIGQQTKARKTDSGIPLPTGGDTEYQTWDITAPATNLARAWEGHRYGGQVLKNCLEPLICAQKPWEGKRLDCIVETGAGSLWVDGGRVAAEPVEPRFYNGDTPVMNGIFNGGQPLNWRRNTEHNQKGRWPPNFTVTHNPACHRVIVRVACPECGGSGKLHKHTVGNEILDPLCETVTECQTCQGSGEVAETGVKRVKGDTLKPDAMKANVGGWKNTSKLKRQFNYGGEDGTEPIPRYACAQKCQACGHEWTAESKELCPQCGGAGEWVCAVRKLGEQSGNRRSAYPDNPKRAERQVGQSQQATWGTYGSEAGLSYADKGTAARFYPNPDFSLETAERLANSDPVFYCAKSSRAEREMGLEGLSLKGPNEIWGDGLNTATKCDPELHTPEGVAARPQRRNNHPCCKPLSLCKWLATLLLPPPEYAPRRLLIPFCGVASEGISAYLAGWDEVVMIEQSAEYCEIGEARLKFWQGWSERSGETEPKAIMKAARKGNKKAAVVVEQQLELALAKG